MTNLVIDVGNSLIKTAVFENESLVYSDTFEHITRNDVEKIFENNKIEAAILSSVRDFDNSILSLIKERCFFLPMSYQISIPVENCYETPETLGMDRLAGVVGASVVFPGKNSLVIDAGTCITYDIITSRKEYLGGSISPGLQMRFRALNNFTGKLPLLKMKDIDYLFGKNTEESVLAGIINGTIAEIDEIINKFKKQFSDLQVIFCGGNTFFFDKKLKNRIFAFEKIVLYGLNEILNYNVQKQKFTKSD